MKPEEAYGAAKWFQSQADKAAAEAARVRQEAEEAGQYHGIARMIANDPQLLGVLSNAVQAREQGQMPPAPQAQMQSPQAQQVAPQFTPPPDVPEEIFDDDGQAVKQFMGWAKDTIAQQAQVIEGLNSKLGQNESFVQEQQRIAQREAAINEVVYKHGMNRTDGAEFVDALMSGQIQNDPVMMLNGWRASRRPTADDVRQQNALETAQQRQQQRTPGTATAQPGSSGTHQPPSDVLFTTAEGGGNDPYAT
jgi:hypothetical protein